MALMVASPDKLNVLPGAVLLDLDNTIYPYEPSHEVALARVREKAERLLSIPHGDFDTLYARARAEVKARLGNTAASHSRLLYFQRLIELAGFKTQVIIALDLEQTYWRNFLSHAEPFDDALEFLDDMRLLGIPIIVVTDLTAQIQFRKIVHFGLDHYIDYVVSSEEAGADKPALAPFELALAKVGLISGPIWVIGDDAATDIKGAAALKTAVAIQKCHTGVKRSDAVDLTFDAFAELRGMLARLAADRK
jgi:putative hydrolase of the HAD superfamily